MMPISLDTLSFAFRERGNLPAKHAPARTARRYIDFVVSGQSLGQLLDIVTVDLIGTFGWTDNMACELDEIDEFTGVKLPVLDTGRSGFYVCPECGELTCGGITALIEVTEKTVTWKAFGYERSYSDAEPDLDSYAHIGPYLFDKQQYVTLFQDYKKTITHHPEK